MRFAIFFSPISLKFASRCLRSQGAVAGGTFLVDFLGKRFSVPVSNTMFVGQAVTIKVDMNAVA
jgi:hypothetical protein